jgi:hypothetical protein
MDAMSHTYLGCIQATVIMSPVLVMSRRQWTGIETYVVTARASKGPRKAGKALERLELPSVFA